MAGKTTLNKNKSVRSILLRGVFWRIVIIEAILLVWSVGWRAFSQGGDIGELAAYAGRIVLLIAIILLLCVSCAAGNIRYDDKPAGFWAGLWHGLIFIVTFIIGLFTDTVQMYETNNVGNLYDFGFLLGVLIILHRSGTSCWKQKKGKDKDDWEEIGQKVEEKVKRGIQNWLDEPDKKEDEWEEIGKKIEEKIKRELRNWAEK